MEQRIQVALLILRISFALFFVVWVGEKFLNPGATIGISAHFYGLTLPTWAPMIIGVFQGAILLGFLIGCAKFWTYGALLVMHGVSMLVSWEQLIAPYEGGNHLFHAGLPTLGVILVLFLLRDLDTLWSPLSRRSGSA